MSKNLSSKVVVLSMASEMRPREYVEIKTQGKKHINFGKDNKYPLHLFELFRTSPKHGAIVKGKVKYIYGKGLKFDAPDAERYDAVLQVVNSAGETLNQVYRKCALDFEIFNGYYLMLVWARGGMLSDVVHVDFTKVRAAPDGKMFYIKEDWTANKGEVKEVPAFDVNDRQGAQLLFVRDYQPAAGVYVRPEYEQALDYIQADALVAGHVLNNAKTGFTGSKMITFTDGEPDTDEEEHDIEKRINEKFTGKNGSKLVISFVNGADKAPKIDDLGVSDLSKEDFAQVDNLISQNIFTGHQVTSGMLFGVKTEGQLGGRNEMREAYEMFKNTYVSERQQFHEQVFTRIMEIQGLPAVKVVPVEPIGFEFSEAVIKEFAPREYILEKIGVDASKYEAEGVTDKGSRIVDAINSLSPLVANKVLESMTADEIRAIVGLGKREDQPAPGAPPGQPAPIELSAEDDRAIDFFANAGEPAENFFRFRSKKVQAIGAQAFLKEHDKELALAFAEVTQLEVGIIDILKQDKRADAETISRALQVDKELVARVLTTMREKGLIKVRTEKVGDERQTTREVTEEGRAAVRSTRPLSVDVEIRYSYEGPKDDRNRPFCARMMQLKKLYTRGEIERLSQELGYSVWERRGGFYHNPATGVTTPYCRHSWVQNVVLKRR